jgi:hypothetical protein
MLRRLIGRNSSVARPVLKMDHAKVRVILSCRISLEVSGVAKGGTK